MRNLLLCLGVSLLLVVASCSCNSYPERTGKTAILGAFDEETTLLKEQLTKRRQYEIEELQFITGQIGNRSVVLAETGIGKVNAAMTATLLIEHFKPDEVIFTGIAGSINPEILPGDIVIGEKSTQHDYVLFTNKGPQSEETINPIKDSHNPVFFQADERLLQAALVASKTVQLEPIKTNGNPRQPVILKGIIATGDSFVASEKFGQQLRKNLGADAVEMEGAAVAQICYQREVPCIAIRSISDKADEKAVADLEKFYRTAARNSAKLVVEMMRQLGQDNQTNYRQ